jgi:HSP20 family molecular chaperone IbpA
MSSNETSIPAREGDAAEKMEQRPTTAPLVDIFENNDELLVVADMPGVAKDNVSINFDKGQLTIEGRRSATTGSGLLAAEFRPLDYHRTFLVPQGIDTDKIAAELQHGVLRVHLPKSAALKPRQIAIKAG